MVRPCQALEMEKYHPEQEIPPKKLSSIIQVIKPNQSNLFSPPKPLPTCKVCVELPKKQQISTQLPNLSAHVTGCPNFIEMNMHTRISMCNALKLCKMCMREDGENHDKICMVLKLKTKNKTKSKYEFTCSEEYCYRHIWLCTKHKAQNQSSMDTKANQLSRDHGLRLVHLIWL